MKTVTGLLLAAAIGMSATGCVSMTELSSERVRDIQPRRVAAYIPRATGQSSASTYAYAAPTRATSTRVASTRSSKAVRGKSRSAKSNIHGLVGKHARAAGVPVKLALAVVQVESNFNPRARGQAGEVGLMQIKPATARGIGYKGSIKALYNPSTNLTWGMKYLAEAHRRGGGTVCGTILKYNAGHYAKRMNKTSTHYCGKIKLIMQKTA